MELAFLSTAAAARQVLQRAGINVRHTVSERDGIDLLELETDSGTVWIQPVLGGDGKARLSIELVEELEGKIEAGRELMAADEREYGPVPKRMQDEARRQLAAAREAGRRMEESGGRVVASLRAAAAALRNAETELPNRVCWSGPTYAHGPHVWREEKNGPWFWCKGASTDRT